MRARAVSWSSPAAALQPITSPVSGSIESSPACSAGGAPEWSRVMGVSVLPAGPDAGSVATGRAGGQRGAARHLSFRRGAAQATRRGGTERRRRTLSHRVAQHADALDLALDHVARLEEFGRVAREADALRRAGGDYVARFECQAGGEAGDHRRDVEDQLARAAVLLGLAVDAQGDAQVVRRAQFVPR